MDVLDNQRSRPDNLRRKDKNCCNLKKMIFKSRGVIKAANSQAIVVDFGITKIQVKTRNLEGQK